MLFFPKAWGTHATCTLLQKGLDVAGFPSGKTRAGLAGRRKRFLLDIASRGDARSSSKPGRTRRDPGATGTGKDQCITSLSTSSSDSARSVEEHSRTQACGTYLPTMTWASVHVPHLLCPNQLRPAPLLPRVCGEAGTSLAVLTTNRLRPMLVSYRQLWVAKQNFSREYSTGRKVLGRGVSVRRTCLPSLRHRGR